MKKNQYVSLRSHIKVYRNSGAVSKYQSVNQSIWGLWLCSGFTNGQLEIEKVQKSKITQLISNYQVK